MSTSVAPGHQHTSFYSSHTYVCMYTHTHIHTHTHLDLFRKFLDNLDMSLMNQSLREREVVCHIATKEPGHIFPCYNIAFLHSVREEGRRGDKTRGIKYAQSPPLYQHQPKSCNRLKHKLVCCAVQTSDHCSSTQLHYW